MCRATWDASWTRSWYSPSKPTPGWVFIMTRPPACLPGFAVSLGQNVSLEKCPLFSPSSPLTSSTPDTSFYQWVPFILVLQVWQFVHLLKSLKCSITHNRLRSCWELPKVWVEMILGEMSQFNSQSLDWNHIRGCPIRCPTKLALAEPTKHHKNRPFEETHKIYLTLWLIWYFNK